MICNNGNNDLKLVAFICRGTLRDNNLSPK